MTTEMAVGTAPLVSVRNASFGYNGVGVLSDVNFTVSSGEVVVVTGHNGSGKSTMTKGMLGLCEVLSGDVEMFGTPHAEFTQRSRVGYVPQRHTVGGPLPATVREVVASGRLGRLPWYKWLSTVDHGIVDKAIETVALISQRDVPVDNLSGGQQRRVLIARAIAAEPELMLMDEPTAGVDVANQQLLVQSLVKLVNQGMALVIVSHELEPLLPIATRRVTVEHGHLVSDENLSTSVTHDSTPQLRIPEQAATPPELTETVESAARQTVSTATQHQIRPQLADRRTAARPGRVIASSRPSRLRPLKPAVIQPTHQYLWR